MNKERGVTVLIPSDLASSLGGLPNVAGSEPKNHLSRSAGEVGSRSDPGEGAVGERTNPPAPSAPMTHPPAS